MIEKGIMRKEGEDNVRVRQEQSVFVCVCVCVAAPHPDALFVAVGGSSRPGTLLFGEDDDVLVEEDVPHACTLPPGSPTHSQLTVPHQLTALCHRDLKSHKTNKQHTHIRIHLSWPEANDQRLYLQKISP